MNDRTLSFHESGHAVISLAMDVGVSFATIRSDRSGPPRVQMTKPFGQFTPMQLCVSLFAGASAERRGVGSRHPFCRRDLSYIETLLLLTKPSERQGHRQLYRALADAKVEASWPAIDRVAYALRQNQKLSGREIASLCGRR